MATTKFASPIIVAEVFLEAEECSTCGVIYALTRDFIAARHRDGKFWYCPNGHQWKYTETDLQKALKRAEEAERRVEMERGWRSEAYQSLDAEKRSHSATKGQLTKTRKRIQNGVCPDCNRHFVNVERHMASKHPGRIAGAVPA